MTMPVPWSIASDAPMLRARVDVDAGVAVRDLGEHPRDERHLASLQLVGEAVDRDREEAGVGEDDLVDGVRGGVAVADRLGVDEQRLPDGGEVAKEPGDDVVGVGAVGLGEPQGMGEQVAEGGELVGDVAGLAAHLGGEVGEEELQRLVDDLLADDAQLGWERVLLALASELVEEQRGEVALGGGGHGGDSTRWRPGPCVDRV